MQLYFKLNLRANPQMGEYPIQIAVGNNRKTAYITTEYTANPDFWLNENGVVLVPTPENQKINALLTLEKIRLEEKINEGIELNRIFPDSNPVDIKAYIDNSQHIKRESRDVETIWRMHISMKRTQKTKENVYNDMVLWKKYQHTPLDVRAITYEYNLKFLHWLMDKKYSASTINHVFCALRQCWYYALNTNVLQGIQKNPFQNLPKPQEKKTEYRTMSKEEFVKLCADKETTAVDIFKLSLFLCGMNYIDLYHLKKTDVDKNGVLSFVRRKMQTRGGVKIYIKIPDEAQTLIDKYKAPDDDEYLLNFHIDHPTYKYFLINLCNQYLRISKRVGFKVQPYLARYSWATTAFDMGVQESTIDLGLGHAGKTMATRHYIKPNFNKVDEANKKVIEYYTKNI